MTNKQRYVEMMKKNYKKQKEVEKLYEEVHGVTPQIYAAIALVLYQKHNWDSDKIEELFLDTVDLWDKYNDSGENMCETCERLTGIDVEEERL